MKFILLIIIHSTKCLKDKASYSLFPSSGSLQFGDAKNTYDRDGNAYPVIDGGAEFDSMKDRKELF